MQPQLFYVFVSYMRSYKILQANFFEKHAVAPTITKVRIIAVYLWCYILLPALVGHVILSVKLLACHYVGSTSTVSTFYKVCAKASIIHFRRAYLWDLGMLI